MVSEGLTMSDNSKKHVSKKFLYSAIGRKRNKREKQKKYLGIKTIIIFSMQQIEMLFEHDWLGVELHKPIHLPGTEAGRNM